MKPLKFYVYMYCSLKDYYGDSSKAFPVFLAVLLLNVSTIVFFYLSINDLQTVDVVFFSPYDDYFAARGYVFIVDMIPLMAAIGLIYLLRRGKIKQYLAEFKQYPKEIRKKNNKRTIIYYVVSGILFVVSMFSSSFL